MDVKCVRKSLKEFKISELFIEHLGWERPVSSDEAFIDIQEKSIPYFHIAQIANIPILNFSSRTWSRFKNKKEREKLHQKIRRSHEKHLVCFSDSTSYLSLSYLSKEGKVRIHDFFKHQNGDSFIDKLAGIHIGIDENTPKFSEIAQKIDKSFNTEEVTNKFYRDFKEGHLSFQKYIMGVDKEEDKEWYSSVILNRLMFIWFLQKKGFLNNDRNYLLTNFKKFKNKKNSFYSKFLIPLFFEGFAKRENERSDHAKRVLGEIRYLNGGLFIPHVIEEKYTNKISITDKAFAKIFEIFNKYNWHDEDNKGSSNEISPDVLGYIFEKYINDSQKKSMGAFYTRDEITGYLSKFNIHNYIVEKVNEKGNSFKDINEVLYNLNVSLCKVLLTDKKSILNTLTILDPAVGSGAFLIAALKELIGIYAPIIGKMETLGNREIKEWLDNFKRTHKSILYGIKKNIILKNLYGVDIMQEATEVCKLRLFLSLASAALEKKELEPLPNIDFNIMSGNSLVGFLKHDNTENSYAQNLERYQSLVNTYKGKELLFDKLKELKNKISAFLKESNKKDNRNIVNDCNKRSVKYCILNIEKRVESRRDIEEKDVEGLSPFHWDFCFGNIVKRGGFDIILTNPPWGKVKLEDKEFCSAYDRNVAVNNTTREELLRIKTNLLKDHNIQKEYKEQNSLYYFQGDYFKNFYKHQAGYLCDFNGEAVLNTNGLPKKATADMDTYRLFTERCFNLVKKSGRIGMVIPSGLGKDDGSIGLRKFIFENKKIDGLIDFQNQGVDGRIFEGVHPQFTFGLLNLQNSKPKDEFPCKFGEKDLKSLITFPEGAMKQSIKEIKKISPRDCSIIEFKHPMDKKIISKAMKFPALEENIFNTWSTHIYGEFHETNDNHLFESRKINENHLPLYKGGAIYQYEYNFDSDKASRYVDKNQSRVISGKGFAFQNKCYKDYRLVVRDIASSTNERSLISAIIPKNSFITNTLHAVSIKEKSGCRYLLFLQSFLNSFTVDYLIRKRISTHVNSKFLKPLNIPRLSKKNKIFNKLVEKSAQLTYIGEEFNELADEIEIQRDVIKDQKKRWRIQAEIDAMVAHSYGLSDDEYKHILSTFTTGDNQNRLQTLKIMAMEEFSKMNTLPEAVLNKEW